MSKIVYYIGGMPGNGKEVIAKLESLGGINSDNLTGEDADAIYFIGGNNIITETLDECEEKIIKSVGQCLSL